MLEKTHGIIFEYGIRFERIVLCFTFCSSATWKLCYDAFFFVCQFFQQNDWKSNGVYIVNPISGWVENIC